jgi:phospholipid/cholesterol/gamma-HCH transport system permease protein
MARLSVTSVYYRRVPWLRFLDRLGRKGSVPLDYLGGLAEMAGSAIAGAFRKPMYGYEILRQMDENGVKSLAITNVSALFIGMVLALQSAYSLAAFGGKLFIGRVVSLALVRELGPVVTALMVGGRVGAGITAELGSMTVTEQVDALRAMAVSPVKRLVTPRLVAIVVMLPLLTALADLLGILGGLAIAIWELQVTASFYFNSIWNQLRISDISSGIGKSFFFAMLIALIGCYNGLNVTGGAAAVGRSTTRTVVAASISILVADFFLTKLFLAL